MNKQSIKKNFVFQFLYQILIFVIPLIISPYLTRTLGGESLGIYSYTYSIAYYFLLFANLGIRRHGQRAVAAARSDELRLRKTFWSLYIIHLFFSVISIISFVIFSLLFTKEYTWVYLIQSLVVVSAMFDITWLFYGLENFKSVVIRNTIVKITECILIFICVKTPDDLWKYTLIMGFSICVGQIIMIPQAIAIVKPIIPKFNDIFLHLKPLLILFIAVVASTLYTVFDKTLLGLLQNDISNVAYYEYSDKIINIPKQLIAVIGTVMFPRACKNFADNNIDELKKSLFLSMEMVALISAGCVFGLFAVSNKFTILYYGEQFSACGDVIKYMAPLIMIVMLGDILRGQYIIPANKDIVYVIGMIISAVINIVVSVILIQKLGIMGAICGTTLAELFGFIYQMLASKKVIKFRELAKITLPFIIDGAIMFAVVYFIDINSPKTVSWVIIEVIIGSLLYCVISMLTIKMFYQTLWHRIINSIPRLEWIKK